MGFGREKKWTGEPVTIVLKTSLCPLEKRNCFFNSSKMLYVKVSVCSVSSYSVLVHSVSPHQCVAFFCAVSQRIYSSVSLCVGLLKELETGLKQWHTQIANRSIALRVNSHIWIMGCQNDLPRQVGKSKETLRAASRFFDPPLIRKKWMRQSSFPVVKPVFHWRAWSLERIADYFRAHVTWQWRLLCSFNSLKVFQKAVKSALQTVNIGNITSLAQPQTRSLFSFCVATIRFPLFLLVLANSWFTKSVPEGLFTASLLIYLRERKSERRQREEQGDSASGFEILWSLTHQRKWMPQSSFCWSNRFSLMRMITHTRPRYVLMATAGSGFPSS